MSTFRLATLNVHSFRNPSTYQSNIPGLVSILLPYDLDLIAIQEISGEDRLKKFSSQLSLPNFIYGPAYENFFGNGFASRYPISFYSNEQSNPTITDEQRSLLQCRLDGDHPFIQNRTFAVTHLDHRDEDLRLKQIKQFNPIEHQIDVLLGDMNALTRNDYSDQFYHEQILSVRQRHFWEEPRFDLTTLLTEEWDYQDAFKQFNPDKKDEELSTCRYQTRIDYIYLHPRVNDQWILTRCEILDTQGLTDHHAVLAEFQSKDSIDRRFYSETKKMSNDQPHGSPPFVSSSDSSSLFSSGYD